eukprot:TRINITY_DN3715_c0_g1_i1.p1 TRINITY_DN3715_c0_g1~~TRINITY_DN3715_c0_g1_i1.p1  ORF type:complete len:237 (+),score=49.80 TRINITY_DN3715_c0_g1_i1:45-755(+)
MYKLFVETKDGEVEELVGNKNNLRDMIKAAGLADESVIVVYGIKSNAKDWRRVFGSDVKFQFEEGEFDEIIVFPTNKDETPNLILRRIGLMLENTLGTAIFSAHDMVLDDMLKYPIPSIIQEKFSSFSDGTSSESELLDTVNALKDYVPTVSSLFKSSKDHIPIRKHSAKTLMRLAELCIKKEDCKKKAVAIVKLFDVVKELYGIDPLKPRSYADWIQLEQDNMDLAEQRMKEIGF